MTIAQAHTAFERVYIVGLSGAGKTSLARRLAQRYGLRHIEIDALNRGPGWQAAAADELHERTRAVLAESPRWAADGNYSALRELLWPAADTIIWLDYPLGLVLGRLGRRTWQRVLTREELWNGNRETLRGALFSRDSLLLYVLRVYHRRNKTCSALFAERSNPRAVYLRFRHPRELEAWERALPAAGESGAASRAVGQEQAAPARSPVTGRPTIQGNPAGQPAGRRRAYPGSGCRSR